MSDVMMVNPLPTMSDTFNMYVVYWRTTIYRFCFGLVELSARKFVLAANLAPIINFCEVTYNSGYVRKDWGVAHWTCIGITADSNMTVLALAK